MLTRTMSKTAPLTALLALGMVPACHRQQPDPLADCRALLDLPKRNATADADSAAARGDHRVLMLGGFSGEIPGVTAPVTTSPGKVGTIAPYGNGSRFIGARMMRGTSDVETPQCFALKPATRRYALAYNQRMLSHLPPPRP